MESKSIKANFTELSWWYYTIPNRSTHSKLINYYRAIKKNEQKL